MLRYSFLIQKLSSFLVEFSDINPCDSSTHSVFSHLLLN
nr:MAG TPA: hypothetical protein [Caudoviricetes sp.]